MFRFPLFLITTLLAITSNAQELTGIVTAIADGDTLTILDSENKQHKIRLADIDAPELGRGRNKPGQPFAANSRQALADRCYQKVAIVQVTDTDRYPRHNRSAPSKHPSAAGAPRRFAPTPAKRASNHTGGDSRQQPLATTPACA